jgi:phosphoribosylformylglycinamidine synthase
VAVPRSEEVRFEDLCTAQGVPVLKIGATAETCTPGAGAPTQDLPEDHVHAAAVEVRGLFTLPLAEAREVFEGTLPRYFG